MDSELTEKINILYKIQKNLDYLTRQKQIIKDEVEKMIIDRKLHNKRLAIGDRYIVYKKNQINQTLSQKYLGDTLLRYFGDEVKVERLMKYILDNRNKKTNYVLEINKKPTVKSKR